jgi:hypothetical protein
VIDNSGVRIGPVALEFESPESLRAYGIPDNIIQMFQPYFNQSGMAAVQLLQQRPLRLSQEQYNLVEQRVVAFWRTKLANVPKMATREPLVERLFELAKERQWPQLLAAVAAARIGVEQSPKEPQQQSSSQPEEKAGQQPGKQSGEKAPQPGQENAQQSPSKA